MSATLVSRCEIEYRFFTAQQSRLKRIKGGAAESDHDLIESAHKEVSGKPKPNSVYMNRELEHRLRTKVTSRCQIPKLVTLQPSEVGFLS